jgi:hypothetical protein
VNLLPPPGASPAERLKHDRDVLELVVKVKKDLIAVPAKATNEQAKAAFANLVDPLLRFSTCPDFVVNRGHYLGTSSFKEEPGLSDADKRALIEFLKTL